MPSRPNPSPLSRLPGDSLRGEESAVAPVPKNLVVSPLMTLGIPHAQDLWRRASAGDAAARNELRRWTLAKLEPRLAGMARHLHAHACISESANPRIPSSEDALKQIALAAVDTAISAWDGLGDWVDYSVVFSVKAMWDAVVVAFAASTLAVVHESLDSLGFPGDVHATLQTRIPEVVDAVCARAPKEWLMRAHSCPSWSAFVLALAVELFRAAGWALAAPALNWKPTKAELQAFDRLARRFATTGTGHLNYRLKGELVSEAVFRVTCASSSYNPARGRWKAFSTTVAENALLALLDPRRSHNLNVIWWIIRDAIEGLHCRQKREPTLDEIVAALDPQWARGERKTARFSRSMVSKVIAMFACVPAEADAAGSRSIEQQVAEELAIRANLSDEETKLLQLRLAGWNHSDIAVKLATSEGNSRKMTFWILKKLKAVAKQITTEEWKVLNLKIAEEKSHAQIAKDLGVPESRTLVLWHYAMEQLLSFPELHVKLTEPEWEILKLALTGLTRAQICARSGISCREVLALLKRGIGKLMPPNP